MGGLWGIQPTPPQDSEILLCLEALVCAGSRCGLRDEGPRWEYLAESVVRKPNLEPLRARNLLPNECPPLLSFISKPGMGPRFPQLLQASSLSWGQGRIQDETRNWVKRIST